MPRTNLTETQLANLDDRSLRLIDLVRLELPDGTVKRFTNAEADVTSTAVDGSTSESYLTGQGYLNHGPIPLTSQINANRIQITFDSTVTDSSATQPISRVLLNNPISGGSVIIIKRLVKSTDTNFNANPSHGVEFIVFKGLMDNVSYKVTNTESTVTLFCGGPFANFDRTSVYGFTNTASQQKKYPNDTGFDFSANNASNIRWEE